MFPSGDQSDDAEEECHQGNQPSAQHGRKSGKLADHVVPREREAQASRRQRQDAKKN